jgi:sugar lactone lactonase YvrE
MLNRFRISVVVALAGVVGFFATTRAQSPGGAFVNFESGHVRPLALSPDGTMLFAVNTPDNRLAIYSVGGGGLTFAAEVQVGLEPVAVAARSNTEVWVVNHLSDSLSIVTVVPGNLAASRVTRTLLTCDEPRDIVFAGSGNGRAFVTTARRGQNCSVAANATTAGTPRAVVQVYDATNLGTSLAGTPLATLALFADTPRALARTPDGSRVYAAAFHSGNRTAVVPEPNVSSNGGLPSAPAGSTPGNPPTGLIVRFNGSTWVDEINRSWNGQVPFNLPDRDVFIIDANANPPALVSGTSSVVGVGSVLFNMAVRPNATNQLYVANTEARNHVRFEPRVVGDPLGRGVQGHIAESRITVVNGTTPTARHLNPHIDYLCTPPGCVPGAAEREASLAFPMDMVFSSNGQRLYVAGFGSGKVGIFDAAALEAGTINASTKTLVEVGGGPSGLALDEARDRLYVMNRFTHDISIVSNASNPVSAIETAVVPLRFNPEPAVVRDGRPFLYDARATSGHGDSACASCHIFGDLDSLAWDLGDPFGAVEANDNPFRLVAAGGPISGGGDGVGIACPNCEFHPMKGPMTTQTLRGMAGAGPMHWRGDRTGSATGQDPLNEDLAFKAFNPAFVGLLGRGAQLSASEMQAFTTFILTVVLPPNPVRALDDGLTTAQNTGQNLFLNRNTDGGALTCVFCHRLPFGTDGLSTFEGEPQEFKIAHLRNLYQKVGRFGVAGGASVGDQIRGFGFLHDGAVSTIQNFVSAGVFQNLNLTDEQNLEQFMLAFDAGLKQSVGQQVSIDAGSFNTTAFVNRINLLVARDDAGQCEVTVKGTVGGEARGGVYIGGGSFQLDRHADAPLTTTAVRNLAATAGQEMTFTCVPPGTGARIGIDRDLDGVFDRREIDCGTDPANAASFPSTLTGACAGVTTTTTSTSTTTTAPPTTTTTSTVVVTTTTTSTLATTSTTTTSTTSSTTSTTLGTSTTTTTTVAGTSTTTTVPPGATIGIQSTSLSLRDRTSPPTPSARKLSFKSKTRTDPQPNRVVVPAPGSAGDPTANGAVVTVYNAAGSGERVTVTLPASGWKLLGSPSAPKGYRFGGADGTFPISRVIVKADQVKVKGGRENWAYTLDEPSQGRVAVRLQLGGGPTWCAAAPARASGNPPSTTGNDQVDRFGGQPKAPAPAVCPSLP